MHRCGYYYAAHFVYPPLACSRARRGDRVGAEAALDQLADAIGIDANRYRVLVALGDGDLLAAQERLARAWWRSGLAPEPVLADLAAAVALIEAGHALDETPLAAEGERGGAVLGRPGGAVLSRLADDARPCPRAGRCRYRPHGGSRRRTPVARGHAGRTGASWETAAASAHLAQVRLARGEPDAARRSLEAAVRTFLVLGAAPAARAATRWAAEVGLPTVLGPGDQPLRIIVMTDIVGSTAMNVRLGDDAYVQVLRAHDRIVRAALRRHGGVEFKHSGDGVNAWFEDAAFRGSIRRRPCRTSSTSGTAATRHPAARALRDVMRPTDPPRRRLVRRRPLRGGAGVRPGRWRRRLPVGVGSLARPGRCRRLRGGRPPGAARVLRGSDRYSPPAAEKSLTSANVGTPGVELMPMMPYHVEKGAGLLRSSSRSSTIQRHAAHGGEGPAGPPKPGHGAPMKQSSSSTTTLTGRPPITGGTWAEHFAGLAGREPVPEPELDRVLDRVPRRSRRDRPAHVPPCARGGARCRSRRRRRTRPSERHWPIQILWHCGQPWFEGWVAWRAVSRGWGRHGAVGHARPHTEASYAAGSRPPLPARAGTMPRIQAPSTPPTPAGGAVEGSWWSHTENHVREKPSEGLARVHWRVIGRCPAS